MHFLPTSQRIVQFSDGREPKDTDVVVYVDGAFDLFRTRALTGVAFVANAVLLNFRCWPH